jgi:uncharacterized protein YqjF (DUF2071 family)
MINDLTHRPWPLPESSWIMTQRWHDLLFMHWPLPISVLQPFIPKELSVESFNGSAWIGIVPFRMSNVRLKGFPGLPGTSAFPELNVRTYVTDGKKPGVWFFSLDATSPLAVKIARLWYQLPYFHAEMSIQTIGDTFQYKSQRRVFKTVRPELSVEYEPLGQSFLAPKGSIEHWLTERYCLYTVGYKNIYRSEIHHPPWKLQEARAKILTNTMSQFLSVPLPNTQPLLHFSRFQEVLVWNLQKLK